MRIGACVLAAALMALSCARAWADPLVFNVTLNTTPLQSSDAGPFYLDFQLTGGNANAVTIDNFNFGGGSAVGSPSIQPGGSASGSLAGAVALNSVGADNELWQRFTPGGTLSFRVTTTAILTPGTPDGFFFNILDSTLTNIPTLDPSPNNDFLSLTYSPGGPILSLFASNPNVAPNGSVSNTPIGQIDAPDVSYPAAAPLPSSMLSGIALLVGCGLWTLWTIRVGCEKVRRNCGGVLGMHSSQNF